MRLDIQLFRDRTKEGVATLLDAGAAPVTFRCLGKSDSIAAAAHGNPSRDPLHVFGDIPTGEFNAVKTVPASPATPDNLRSYGPGVRFVLNGISGQAAQAVKNGRFGILIHGGPTGAPMPPNALRPTHGCLRVDDSTINTLNKRLIEKRSNSFPVSVREVQAIEAPDIVATRYGVSTAAALPVT